MASNPPSTTPAEAAAAFVTYIDELNADRQMFRDWLAGTANGGPNSDGNYPLTDFEGNTYLVACPAKLATIGANLTAALAALPVAAAGDIVASQVGFVGYGKTGGAPMLIPARLVSQAQTASLPSVASLLANDILQIHRADGKDYQIAGAALLQSTANGKINVKDAPYNCKGDYREVRDVTANANSGIITSASAPFSASDVGKLIYLQNPAGTVALARTIIAYSSATQVTVSPAPIYGGANLQCGWGTDDTAGIAAAYAAAAPFKSGLSFANTYGGVVEFPPGLYLTDAIVWPTRVAMFGYGPRQSVLVRKPSTSTSPLIGQASIYNDFQIMLNMGLYGAKFMQGAVQRGWIMGGAPGSATGQFSQSGPYMQANNVWIWETSGDGAVHVGLGGGIIQAMQFYGCAGYGYKTTGFDMDIADMYVNACSQGSVWNTGAGNSFSNCKLSFGGRAPFNNVDTGMNLYDGGTGNAYFNVRCQECWGDNMVLAGSGTTMRAQRLEDTGDIYPGGAGGPTPTAITTRAALKIMPTATELDVEVLPSFAIPASNPRNLATHALFFVDGGNASMMRNRIDVITPTAMSHDSDYYNGGDAPPGGAVVPPTTGNYAPKLVGCSTGAATNPNQWFVRVNDASVI